MGWGANQISIVIITFLLVILACLAYTGQLGFTNRNIQPSKQGFRNRVAQPSREGFISNSFSYY